MRHDRRGFLALLAAALASALLPRTTIATHIAPSAAEGQSSDGGSFTKPITRAGAGSRELLPVIGLGSWITFNTGSDPAGLENARRVIEAFFAEGGRLIDSSPMYGSSQAVIGQALARLKHPAQLFAADKVWTSGDGAAQVEQSRQHWGVPHFDLLQVHNLTAWERQLPLLLEMKAAGRVRFVGITTSEGRRHDEIERVMRTQPIDFVQFSYNLADREAEQRLLPLAQERGIAVICNRPFQQGRLIDQVKRHPLPPWAAEIGCANWAQVLLKFVVSHPAVTCAIPATSQVAHLRENMGAARGVMPDAAMRRRMVAHFEAL